MASHLSCGHVRHSQWHAEVEPGINCKLYTNVQLPFGFAQEPLIPFKCNATPAQGGLWSTMLGYFVLHRDEFLSRYSVRSKTHLAMRNEVLVKLVCRNLRC